MKKCIQRHSGTLVAGIMVLFTLTACGLTGKQRLGMTNGPGEEEVPGNPSIAQSAVAAPSAQGDVKSNVGNLERGIRNTALVS